MTPHALRLTAQNTLLRVQLERRAAGLTRRAALAAGIAQHAERWTAAASFALTLARNAAQGREPPVPESAFKRLKDLPAEIRRLASNARRELQTIRATWTLTGDDQPDTTISDDGKRPPAPIAGNTKKRKTKV